MSATKPRRELASPNSRRRPRAPRSTPQPIPRFNREVGARADGGRDSSSPRPATSTHVPT